MGETWQEAAGREVFEETGVILDPTKIKIFEVITVENGSINLIFGVYDDIIIDPAFAHDHEIMEVIESEVPVETAFPAHTAIIERYLASIGQDISEYGLIERQQP